VKASECEREYYGVVDLMIAAGVGIAGFLDDDDKNTLAATATRATITCDMCVSMHDCQNSELFQFPDIFCLNSY
jgi:alkylhydroperoxidase family enzyme